jgi:uncharacterized SAM-binding protein YcdF (DUF218 family)
MLKRFTIATTALAACLLAFGFIIFAVTAMKAGGDPQQRADGIVVLTGGNARIAAAAKLLRQGNAGRLLISGVNKSTRKKDLMRISDLPSQTFDCCVDVGYRALNTVGNANETKAWVQEKGFKRLIVVTSSYHMPRSLVELKRVLPETELIPHAVFPKSLARERWWLDRTTMRVLVSEYLKFLPAAARYAASRVVGDWSTNALATRPGPSRAKL